MLIKMKSILKTIFGYDSFYPLQEEIIQSILHKNDSLVIMPTGGGKSLCYQIPALIFEGMTVVISPLISLMKDQVDQLIELGVNACLLNSTLLLEEYNDNINRILQKKIKLLYVAPETLVKQDIIQLLHKVSIDCFAIDEAHCISQWGHDFRPEYRRLKLVKNIFPDSVIAALTATATKVVREDIKNHLGFKNSKEFIASFNRPNLFLEIIPKQNPFQQTLMFLNKFKNQSGIIYCFSRRQVEELSQKLLKENFSVRPYHAGLSTEERKNNQELFIKDDIQIIVATIAFGMGINKPNVRFVLHHDLPKNIESYYQEIGRAGRDGLPAHCLLLYSYGDTKKIQYFIEQKENEIHKKAALKHLYDMVKFAESRLCRRYMLIRYFGENYLEQKCEKCDNCTVIKKEEVDITEISKLFLECIRLTGQRFGTHHIINILRGSKDKKIIQYNHDKLTIYNKAGEYAKEQLIPLSNQLISLGIIIKDFDDYGILKLTGKAYDVLKNQLEVYGLINIKNENKYYVNQKTDNYDLTLFEALKKKRKELSILFNVPPYIVFPDQSLIQMSQIFPTNKQDLLKIVGVGDVKLEKYGDMFIQIIQKYLNENPDKKDTKIDIQKTNSKFTPKHILTSMLFNNGSSIEYIMKEFNIKQDTLLTHFYKFLMEGNKLRNNDILKLSRLSDTKIELVLNEFNNNDSNGLKPIFDIFNGEISYEELKILKIYYLSKQNEKQMI